MKVKGIAKLLSAVMAMTCISFPAISHAEETTAEPTVTEAIKADFAIPGNVYDSAAFVKLQALYLGTDTGGGGAEYGMNLTGTRGLTGGGRYYEMNLDDNTLEEDQYRTDKGVNQNPKKADNPTEPDPTDTEKYPNGEEDEAYKTDKAEYDKAKAAYDVYIASTKMIEPNTGWGFHGMKINKYDSENDKFFGAVVNLKSTENTAAAIYKIKVEEGELDGAYLTVGYYGSVRDTNRASAHGYSPEYKEFDKAYPDDANAGMYQLRVAGVNLADYYNDSNPIDEFGYHTVTVPLSEFKTENADLKKTFDATKPAQNFEDTSDFNPGMVKMIGIARQDSRSEKTFKFASRGYAFVAPQAPTEVKAVKTDSGVSITWKNTTDTDVEYTVVKEMNGEKVVLGKSETGSLTEEGFDPSSVDDEIRYYVVASDVTYGVQAVSDSAVFNQIPVTTSLAKQFILPTTGWYDGKQFPTTSAVYYVGPANGSGDYTTTKGGEFKKENGVNIYRAYINDSDTAADNADRAIADGAGWGFRGMQTNWNKSDGEKYGIELPSPGNVVNIKADEDNAYALFNIKVEAGTTDGAYLTIAYFSNAFDTNYYNKYDGNERNVKEFGEEATDPASISLLRTAGLPLSDYYDSAKGGYQTIVIPIKDFKEKDVFKKTFVKTTNTIYPEKVGDYTHDDTLNTGMIKAMGISRIDTKKGAGFTYSTSDISLLTPHTANKFAGNVDNNGNVTLTWKHSTDTDVTNYQIKKDVEGTVEYIDLGSTATGYTDSVDLASGKQVKYSVVTTGDYGIKAETEPFIVNERAMRESDVLYDMQVGMQKENNNYDVPYTAGGFNWYTGAGAGETYGDYNDYSGIAPVWEDYYKIQTAYINDSNHVWDSSAKSSVMGNIVADREYGYAGYRFNNVGNGGPGPVVDLSSHKNGYVVFEVNFEDSNKQVQDLTDVYFTINYGMEWGDVYGYKEGMTYGDPALSKIDHAAAVGVRASDYYDVNKGGYQKIMIPLSAFTDAASPAMKDIITPADTPANIHYDEYLAKAKASDFAEHTDLFAGLAIARKNQSAGKMFKVKTKNMYILDTPAPVDVSAERTSSGVSVTWKRAGLNTSAYEVYRDGRKIADVNGALEYTDTEQLASGEHVYGVKTVSSEYAGHISTEVTAAVTIPRTESITFFKGTGAGRTETKYVEAGTIEADIMSVTPGTQGYAAVFGADGVLKAVKTASLGSETPETLSFANVLASDIVKAFIWKADGTPACKPEKIESRGTRVLVIGDESSVQSTEYLDDIAAADGGKISVVNLYKNGAAMSDHYANINAGSAVYTLAANGTATNENVSFDSIDGDYDYVIIQDKTVYENIDTYYEEGGAADTQIPAIISAIKEKAPNATIIANGTVGFSSVYYENADEKLKEYLTVKGYISFDYLYSYTMIASSAFEGKADVVLDNNGAVALNYDAAGEKVFAQDGCSLSANGKFFVAANLYKAMTNKEIKASFAPSDVTDAETIADAVNNPVG